jgi:hypothetical protein
MLTSSNFFAFITMAVLLIFAEFVTSERVPAHPKPGSYCHHPSLKRHTLAKAVSMSIQFNFCAFTVNLSHT